jgi:hypothetical protein
LGREEINKEEEMRTEMKKEELESEERYEAGKGVIERKRSGRKV